MSYGNPLLGEEGMSQGVLLGFVEVSLESFLEDDLKEEEVLLEGFGGYGLVDFLNCF